MNKSMSGFAGFVLESDLGVFCSDLIFVERSWKFVKRERLGLFVT